MLHTAVTELSRAANEQDMRLAWEEPFGPVVPVIRIKTAEEGVEHCNTNNLALQVGICWPGPACTACAYAEADPGLLAGLPLHEGHQQGHQILCALAC